MGNNTSSTRKSTAGSRHSSGGVRRASRKETDLDEEFSDLILHEVTKSQQQQQSLEHNQQQQFQSNQHLQLSSSPSPSSSQQQSQNQSISQFHSSGSWANIPGTKEYNEQQRARQEEEYEESDGIGGNLDVSDNVKRRRKSSAPYKQFSNDLIEDEFNELNDGLLETDAPELSRNILPNDDDDADDEDSASPDAAAHVGTSNADASANDVMGDIEMEDAGQAAGVTAAASATDIPVIPNVIKPINDMETDDEFPPVTDLSKVDFTKIVPPEGPVASGDSASGSQTPQDAQPAASSGANANANAHGGSTAAAAASVQTAHSGSASASTTGFSLIPVEIKWVNSDKENIQKISIIGSFSNWRDVIRLKPSAAHQNEYVTTINLPLGVHKLLYIINNEYRVSDQLPTATDQEGIFFNWFEVLDEAHLFNHSQNQQNHIGASTDYDANIIHSNQHTHDATQTAGRYEVDRIKKKSTSFLTHVTKSEEQPDFEHVEYQMEDVEAHPAPGPEGTGAALQPPPAHPPAYTTSTPPPPAQGGAAPGPLEETPKYISYQDQKNGSFFTEKAAAQLNYTSEIPEMFLNYDYFKSKGADYQLPEPPQLPAHLNNVLLNKMSSNQNQTHANNIPHVKKSGTQHGSHHNHHQPGNTTPDPFKPPQPAFYEGAGPPGSTHGSSNANKRPPLRRADSSYYASNQEAYHLSIPNHVILNHLMTTSIRNDVLTVACITRYSGKFVTQIMHSPADT